MAAAPLSTPSVNIRRFATACTGLTSCPPMAQGPDFNLGCFSNPVRNMRATTSSTRSLDEACFTSPANNCTTDREVSHSTTLERSRVLHPALGHSRLLRCFHKHLRVLGACAFSTRLAPTILLQMSLASATVTRYITTDMLAFAIFLRARCFCLWKRMHKCPLPAHSRSQSSALVAR